MIVERRGWIDIDLTHDQYTLNCNWCGVKRTTWVHGVSYNNLVSAHLHKKQGEFVFRRRWWP